MTFKRTTVTSALPCRNQAGNGKLKGDIRSLLDILTCKLQVLEFYQSDQPSDDV